jgi:hypothetical protein
MSKYAAHNRLPSKNTTLTYQLTKEEKPIKLKTINKSQPETAKVGNLNPKTKTK